MPIYKNKAQIYGGVLSREEILFEENKTLQRRIHDMEVCINTLKEENKEVELEKFKLITLLKQEVRYLNDCEQGWQIRINELEERIIELEKEKKELINKWNEEVESEW